MMVVVAAAVTTVVVVVVVVVGEPSSLMPQFRRPSFTVDFFP